MGLHDHSSIGPDLAGQKVPAWHIPDAIRVGVLAGLEEHETWFQAHLMRCEACRRPIIDLLGKMLSNEVISDEGEVGCAQARNELIHYLESRRPPNFLMLHHIVSCESCSRTFYEPARAATVLEFDPDEVGEAG